MLNTKNTVKILTVLASFSYSGAVFADENPINKEMACFDLSGERDIAKHFIKNAVEQEIIDEPMLVDVGSSLALLSPLESIKLYDSRIKHIDETYKILGCKSVMSNLTLRNIHISHDIS